jgi:hypothetical protein
MENNEEKGEITPEQCENARSRSKRKGAARDTNTRIPVLSENEHFHIVEHLFPHLLHHFTCPRHPKKALNSFYHLVFFFSLPDLLIAQTTQNEHDFFSIAQIRKGIARDTAKIVIFFICSR